MKLLDPTDLLTLDAHSLQQRMREGSITAVDLLTSCLVQIKMHDDRGAQLRAIISVAPRDLLLRRAQQLDQERASGHVRSDLHGIPILVKDSIATGPASGLKTTVGSLALQDSQPDRASPIIEHLEDMGAIILAKTNLNELCGVKGDGMSNGWSAVGGQTKSAYIQFDPTDRSHLGHTSPCGSSTGSAVGVSAGYSPIALGTDSIGSLISPATRAALYAIKPTPGTVDMSHVWPVSPLFDAIGGLTKSVIDLATVTNCLVSTSATEDLVPRDFRKYLGKTFEGLRIGFVDHRLWCLPPNFMTPIEEVDKQIVEAIETLISRIRHTDDTYVAYPVSLPPVSNFSRNGNMTIVRAITYEIAKGTTRYLRAANVDNVKSIADIVEFNEGCPARELPNGSESQAWLLAGLREPPSKEEFDQDVAHFQRIGRDEGLDELFKRENLNLLAFSTDSLIFNFASAAGYPIASMPMGLLKCNGRPFGLGIIAQAGREDLMFQFMSAFEDMSPARLDHIAGSKETLATAAFALSNLENSSHIIQEANLTSLHA